MGWLKAENIVLLECYYIQTADSRQQAYRELENV